MRQAKILLDRVTHFNSNRFEVNTIPFHTSVEQYAGLRKVFGAVRRIDRFQRCSSRKGGAKAIQ